LIKNYLKKIAIVEKLFKIWQAVKMKLRNICDIQQISSIPFFGNWKIFFGMVLFIEQLTIRRVQCILWLAKSNELKPSIKKL